MDIDTAGTMQAASAEGRFRVCRWLVCAACLLCLHHDAAGQGIKLLRQKRDPYGFPRPGPDEKQVPLRTSFYFELGLESKGRTTDTVLAESVGVRLQAQGAEPVELLRPDWRFAPGCSGKLFYRTDRRGRQSLVVYIDRNRPLQPATVYTVTVAARSRAGAVLGEREGRWQFVTESAPAVHRLRFDLELRAEPVHWHGGFFTGFCKPSFCTSASNRMASYELMEQVRRDSPRAWSLQRDAWLTGMEHQPKFLSGKLPNLVREKQTRRVRAMRHTQRGVELQVEGFFGHEQYGIASGRSLSADYHRGDEVLIADGVHDARAKVLAVDEAAGRVVVTEFAAPPGGWRLDYAGPLPRRQDPAAPGLFPPGGCYLRKFRPPGTPCYYWGRLDKEWDLAHRRFRRRLVVNFVDAPGDLSVDGRNWTRPKDYAEYHEVVGTITGHLIDRYGGACLDFYWSVFNEPDLSVLFWRSDWAQLQKFYDYTVDAVLRAFEDRGYDSDRVRVGGLELGAIFGTHLRLRGFLAHCSPRARAKDAVEENAAFADRRLDGKRSRRVERLCRANGGAGSPCDFISIHAYNRSDLMAAKLARAKQMALAMDPEFYQGLWVNSHESCPGWAPPPDPAAADSYRGNGYFPTWCADVARRQLQRATQDPRFGYGESILTFWPWPNRNFSGANACTRVIHVDEDGDGRADRTVAVAMPILHFLGLMANMGPRYWVLPERTVGGHVVSGFASRSERTLRLLLYSHHALDTQSRSEAAFDCQVRIRGLPSGRARVQQYRFDKDHNSYYRLAQRLLSERNPPPVEVKASAEALAAAIRALAGQDRAAQRAALEKLMALGRAARPAAAALLRFSANTTDAQLRGRAQAALVRISAPECYPAQAVQQVQQQARLRVTASSVVPVEPDGSLRLLLPVAANGANFVVVSYPTGDAVH